MVKLNRGGRRLSSRRLRTPTVSSKRETTLPSWAPQVPQARRRYYTLLRRPRQTIWRLSNVFPCASATFHTAPAIYRCNQLGRINSRILRTRWSRNSPFYATMWRSGYAPLAGKLPRRRLRWWWLQRECGRGRFSIFAVHPVRPTTFPYPCLFLGDYGSSTKSPFQSSASSDLHWL
jgi:hypothetical protein